MTTHEENARVEHPIVRDSAASTCSAPSTRRCRQRAHDLVDTSQRFKWALSVTTVRFVSSSSECAHRDNVPRLQDGHRDWRTSRHCAPESQLLPAVDDNPLLLDLRQRGVEIPVHNIAAEHETVRHALTVARVTSSQRASRLKVAATLAGNEIRRDLSDIQVQRTVEIWEEPSRGDELCKALKEGVFQELDVQNTAANIEHNLVSIAQKRQALTQNSEIRELKQRRHAHDNVVRLHDGLRNLRTNPHREAEYRLIPVFDGQTFQKHAHETRAPYLRHTYCRPRNIEGQFSRSPISSCGPR